MLKELSTPTKQKVRKVIEATNGRFFRVFFTKRTNGELRSMTCRTGVKKFINGKGMKFDPANKDLISVWDPHKWNPETGDTGYRFINLRTVAKIKVDGKEISFD